MPEKIKQLSLHRDYGKYLYFIDAEGNVSRKPKSGEGDAEILIQNAVERDSQYLYFVDREGDISRSPRGTRGAGKKAA